MDPSDYWYCWFPALFRKKTRHLTTFERGVYRELIDEYMETREPLPYDDLALANIAKITLEEWHDTKVKILVFFNEIDKKLSHEFCDEILQNQDARAKKRSKASKKAAATRWKHKQNRKMRNECETNANAMRFYAIGQDRIGKEYTPFISPPKNSENRFKEFWENFPRQRRGSKEKSEIAYRAALKRDEEENILSGLLKYTTSDEVKNGYAKGAAAWLNADKWTDDYTISPKKRKQNGKSIDDIFAELNTELESGTQYSQPDCD